MDPSEPLPDDLQCGLQARTSIPHVLKDRKELPLRHPSTSTRLAEASLPRLSAEIVCIPLEAGRYIVYAPLRHAAFVTNASVVNFLADLHAGILDESFDRDGALVEFLRRLVMIDAGDEALPVTTFSGEPEPTSVTLFLTTACNLRCTYCYALAGDTPTKNMPLAKRGIDFVAANVQRKGVLISRFCITAAMSRQLIGAC
jgi:hypothetical protein